MKSPQVTLIWKRSDPWAKKLGSPREIIVGEYWSSDHAHGAIDDARSKLLDQCKTEDERKEIWQGSWWTQTTEKITE
jgi:hypothetical protein